MKEFKFWGEQKFCPQASALSQKLCHNKCTEIKNKNNSARPNYVLHSVSTAPE